MATAEQIKALVRSHAERDEQRFYSVALQVAASEARVGHHRLAADLKKIIDKGQDRAVTTLASQPTPLVRQPKGELSGLLNVTYPSVRMSDLAMSEGLTDHFHRILLEQRQKDKLAQYGLTPRRKILFTGPPGTGKTMSASMLATELGLPLYTIVLDGLITRYMGETAAKLRVIFDHISQTRAVYLFDEFDAIGTQRGASNDVGEIRRVLNSFLLFVEQDQSESLIIGATNHPELLDKALHRRFDDIIRFDKPDRQQVKQIIENRLTPFELTRLNWQAILEKADGLSGADVSRACEDAAKEAVLNRDSVLSTSDLLKALEYRHLGKY